MLRENPQREVVLTGHSLGGGIAISAQKKFAGSGLIRQAIGFNSSPRYGGGWSLSRSGPDRNPLVIYEEGDPTRVVGNLLAPWRWEWLWRTLGLGALIRYQRYDFQNPTMIEDHEMAKLAAGLLVVADPVDADVRSILERI